MSSESVIKSLLLEGIKKESIKNHQVITESNIHRVFTDYFESGFIVVSAAVTAQRALGKAEVTEEEAVEQQKTNLLRDKELKAELSSGPFGFVPVFGGYREKLVDPDTGESKVIEATSPERSFIVPAHKRGTTHVASYDELLEYGKKLAAKYNQECILAKPPDNIDKKSYFVTPEGQITGSFPDKKLNDLMQSYFTLLRKDFNDPLRHKRRFSVVDPENPTTINESVQFVLYVPRPPSGFSEAIKRYNEEFIRIRT